MYHQNTLKIFSPQYVGIFAVLPFHSLPRLISLLFHTLPRSISLLFYSLSLLA
jgi:hypothetical protein